MKAELKKLVFPVSDSEPVAICEDGAKFSMAMSIFQNYERQVRKIACIVCHIICWK